MELTVKGLASFDQDITVCGNTLYTGSLSVSGNTSMGGTLDVGGNTCIGGNLSVSNNVTICGTLCVQQRTVMSNDVTICGDGYLKIIGENGGLDLYDTQFNQPRIQFYGTRGSSGTPRLRAYIEPSENSSVSETAKGLSIFTGGQLAEAFTVSGNHTIRVTDPAIANYPTPVFEVDGPTGNTDINGTLDVSGNTSIGGNATITGKATAGNLHVTGNVSVDTNLHVASSTCIGGKLTTKSDVSIGKNLIISGNVHAHGNISMAGSLITSVSAGKNENIINATMAANDGFRLRMGGGTNSGYVAFDLKDDGTNSNVGERFLFRKYSGNYQTVCSTLTLLDREGNTQIPGNLQVNGTLSAKGNAVVCGTLGVSGKITGKNGLDIRGNTSFNGNVYVSGTVCVTQDIHATGIISASELRSTLIIATGQTVCADFDVIAERHVKAKTGNLTAGGNLYVSGFSQLGGEIKAGSDISAAGALNIRSSAKINSGLTISAGSIGLTNTYDAINFKRSGNYPTSILRNDGADWWFLYSDPGSGLQGYNSKRPLRINFSTGRLYSSHGQTFNGGQKFTGGTTISDGLTVCANTTICGNLTTIGTGTFGKKVTTSGLFSSVEICTNSRIHGASISLSQGADINGRLDIGGNTCLGGTLIVKGSTTLSGQVTLCSKLNANDISSSGILRVDNNVSFHKNLVVSGNIKGKSNLDVVGTACFGALKVAGNTCLRENLHVSGNVNIKTGTISMGVGVNGNRNLLYGQIANNDFYRIRTGGGNNTGYLAFDVADDGTNGTTGEQILFRKYAGVFTTLCSTLTLLDRSGNTQIPGNLQVNGTLSAKGNAVVAGTLGVSGKTTTCGLFSYRDICTNTDIHAANCSLGSDLTVKGTASVEENLHLGGTFYISASTSSSIYSTKAANLATWKPSGNYPSFIIRNDGSNFYLLFSNAGSSITSNWNDYRPLRINLSTGKLFSENGQNFDGGQRFTGGTVIGDLLTVSGNSIFKGTAEFRKKITTSGLFSSKPISCNDSIHATSISLSQGADINGKLDVGGNISVEGTICAHRNVNISGSLQTRGNISGGSLCVANYAHFSANICVKTTAYISSDITTNRVITCGKDTATGILMKPSGTKATAIMRNDGTRMWFLLSAESTNANGGWLEKFPLSYSVCGSEKGRLYSSEGQTFEGGQIFAGGMSICGNTTIFGASNRLTVCGKLVGATDVNFKAGLQVENTISCNQQIHARNGYTAKEEANGLKFKPSGRKPTTIFRNDGNDFYILHSTSSNNINSSWNSDRPFRISFGDGRLYSNNGQTFRGGTTINSTPVCTDGSAPGFLCRSYGRATGTSSNPSFSGKNCNRVEYNGGSVTTVCFDTNMVGDYAVVVTLGNDDDHVLSVIEKTSRRFKIKNSDPGQGNNTSGGYSHFEWAVFGGF